MRRRHLTSLTAALALASLGALPATASDGALEIHQACVATGCFPGDAPGFPVELSNSGSYVLTSNLAVPDENTTAIVASGKAVSVDLGGFEISGVTECSGVPVACTPTGTGDGVTRLSIPDLRTLSVRNGAIRGMGNRGVQAFGLVENLMVVSNGGGGITNSGITRSNVVQENGEHGIAGGSQIFDNRVAGNGHEGIVSVGGASSIRGNSVSFNGRADGSPGIGVAKGTVLDNIVTDNRGPGLEAVGPVTYGDNHFESNNQTAGPLPGNQVVGGTQLGPNVCHGSPCP